MQLHKLQYTFSVHQVGMQRVKFQNKICFRADLNHLRLKTTPTIAVVSRLYRDGNFLRLYKKLQSAYLKNFINFVKLLPHNNEFKNLYYQYESFRDLNRVLF